MGVSVMESPQHTQLFLLPTDNGYEIGQEPESRPWGTRRGRRRKRGQAGEGEISEDVTRRGRRRKKKSQAGKGEISEDGWVTKRRRKLSGMISECCKVLSQAGDAGGTSGEAEDLDSTSIDDDTIKSNLVTVIL